MRTRGWSGSPPASDDEARERILVATRACIDRDGVGIGIADVARELGIARPTVYRYFPSTELLLIAVVIESTQGLLDRIDQHRRPGRTSLADHVVETVALVLEQLPAEPYLWLMLTEGRSSLFAVGVTSPLSIGFGRALVDRMPVADLSERLTPTELGELVETIVRVVQSFMLDPGRPPRRGKDLRGYLERWLAPAVTALGH